MEQRNKNNLEWRYRFVRRHFGGLTVASIRNTTKEELEILQTFLKDVIKEKKI